MTIEPDLRVRSLPEVSDASAKLSPLLRDGDALYVIGGPVAGSGYDWYEIHAPRTGLTGWVAAASKEGEEWMGEPMTCDGDDPGVFWTFPGVRGSRPDDLGLLPRRRAQWDAPSGSRILRTTVCAVRRRAKVPGLLDKHAHVQATTSCAQEAEETGWTDAISHRGGPPSVDRQRPKGTARGANQAACSSRSWADTIIPTHGSAPAEGENMPPRWHSSGSGAGRRSSSPRCARLSNSAMIRLIKRVYGGRIVTAGRLWTS